MAGFGSCFGTRPNKDPVQLKFDRLPIALALVLALTTLASQRGAEPQKLANQAYIRLFEGAIAGTGGAIDLFRQALVSDPAFPYRWSDLGEAFSENGQVQAAAYCFQRAVVLAPESPQIAVRAANFHFLRGDTASALALYGKALATTGEFDETIFINIWRLGWPASQTLDAAIGSNRRAAGAYFGFLLGHGTPQDLAATWNWLEQHGHAGTPQARLWVPWLLQHGQPALAWSVQGKYLAAAAPADLDNRVENPGFETDWKGDGFEWRAEPFPGIAAATDTAVHHSGARSLRLDFSAPDFDNAANPDFHHVWKPLVLEPGPNVLEAWVRTSDLTTDEGVRLRITAFDGLGILASTYALAGTHDWTRLAIPFTVPGGAPRAPEKARLFRLEVARLHSWSFVNRPNGQAWIDDIRISRVRP